MESASKTLELRSNPAIPRSAGQARWTSTIELADWDGKSDPAPDRLFDGILVDAPCSGLGTWHRNPDARWRISADAVVEKAKVQGRLLDLAAAKLRPGGRLVYAVCTLTRLETTDAIRRFLDAHPDFQLDPGLNPLTGLPGTGEFFLWPWEGDCNGMFCARLRREGKEKTVTAGC